jgi:hypothetical protein
MTTGLDCLVIGNYVITKKQVQSAKYLDFVPELHKFSILSKEKRFVDDLRMSDVYALKNTYKYHKITGLSEEMYKVLLCADGVKTLKGIFDETFPGMGCFERLLNEIKELWEKREIKLSLIPNCNLNDTNNFHLCAKCTQACNRSRVQTRARCEN